ncbi:FAD synthetase [Harpegnathos saltator]|uniref:FAD synthetase n=2 Tax=Harpegnathos saltator TaxID=610380 RepID=E2BNB9_HARSA|nr:FAD synthetase [Harpegnathos saltator]
MSSHYTKVVKHPTAGIIVIGDEILKAQVRDTNSYHMCGLLYKCGVKVKKISVISDSVEEISKEIRDASSKFTYVITSGGIGPTHDDVTFEGLAKAFDDTLHYHPKLVDIIKDHFGAKDPLSPAYKMALIPKKASLKFNLNTRTGKPNAYPYIVLENVYVFPGSPVFFERSFQGLYEDLLSTTNKRFVKDEVFINAREEAFTNALSVVVKEFPNVSFGSYPVSNCRYYKAFVTIESDNKGDTENAKQRFYELNPVDIFVKFDRTPHVDCITKYNNFLQSCPHRRSIYEQLLEELRQFYREPESVSIRMDGGVESSIVIHLAHICRTQSNSNDKLRAVYFMEKQTSIDLEEFIKEMTDKYNLAVCTVEAEPDKSINELITMQAHLRTLLVGKTGEDGVNEVNRRYAGASNADRLQINNPLRNWTNEDVWSFASSLSLPYVTTTA